MAVPLAVVNDITVSELLGPLKVAVNTTSVPSVTDCPTIVTVGFGVTSIIVAVPVAVVLKRFPEVTVPVNVKFSSNSDILSFVVEIFTFIDVWPAGTVTIVLVTV